MILIPQIKQYGENLKSIIPEIKTFLMVVDDSQLVKFMNDINDDGNLILVGLIPSHSVEGQNVDNAQNRDHTIWMVLNKVDRTNGMEAFIESFAFCQMVAKKYKIKCWLINPISMENAS